MPQRLHIRQYLLKLLKRPDTSTVEISPREHVESLNQKLDKFAQELEAEESRDIESYASIQIARFRGKLAGELKRIEEEEQKRPKDRKEGVFSDIDGILDRLEKDILEEQESYRSASMKSIGWRSAQRSDELDKKTKNPLSAKGWSEFLDQDDFDLWPPEHTMRDPTLYAKRGIRGGPGNPRRPAEEIELMEAKRQRWGTILGWASSTKTWEPEEVPAFTKGTLWKQGRAVETGSYGQVFVAAVLGDKPRPDGKAVGVVACKRMKFDTSGEIYSQAQRQLLLEHNDALREAEKHVHVVRIVACENLPKEHLLFMEFVSGGNLTTMLRHLTRITEDEAIEIVKQVARGLQHLHGLGIVHRDLKGRNTLVNLAGCVKIGDLDTSKSTYRTEHVEGAQSGFGTPQWMAPEAAIGCYTPLSDMWSLGCVIVELLTGRPPDIPVGRDFDGEELTVSESLKRMHYSMEVSGPKLPHENRLSPLGRSILTEKVFVPVGKRISVFNLLETTWFKGFNGVTFTPDSPPETVDIEKVAGDYSQSPLRMYNR